MDLKRYKFIQNAKKQLSKINPMDAIGFGSSLFDAFNTKSVPTEDNLIMDSGQSRGVSNGVSYERINQIDEDSAMSQLRSENTSNTLNAATTGAKIGSTFGPIGGVVGGVLGAIGGLFGGKRRKRKLEDRIQEAQRLVERTNQFNLSGANTQALQRDYYTDNSTLSSNILYANKGKDMNKVWTPTGYRTGHINSMVGKGESIIDFNRGTGTLVTKGVKGVDNQPSSVKPGDDNVILGNDVDWTNGLKFLDQAAPYTARLQEINNMANRSNKYDRLSSLSKQTQNVQEREINRVKQPLIDALGNISARQEKQHQIENKAALGAFDGGKDGHVLSEIQKTAKRGPFKWFFPGGLVTDIEKTPIKLRYPVGPTVSMNNTESKSDTENDSNGELIPTWQRMFPSAFGLLQSINQYNMYNNQPVRSTNTYRSNPYANEALRGLASLRYNMYPELQAVRDAERRGAYVLNNLGGLSAGQRAASIVANTLGTQRNLSQVYSNASNQNNQYRSTYYDALMKAGQADRQARIAAFLQDYQNYAAAQGAKYTNRDKAIANMINQLNNWYSNEFKYKTYRDTSNIYRQKLSDKQKDIASDAESSLAKNNNPQYTASTTNTNPRNTNPYWLVGTKSIPAPYFPIDFSFTNYLRRNRS